MVKPSGREIHVGMRSVRAKAAPIESGSAITITMTAEAMVPQMIASAPNCAPGPPSVALVAIRPGAPVEEVPPVMTDDRNRLHGEHREGEDQSGEREDDRHPGHAAPARLLVAAEKIGCPLGQRRLADRLRLRCGGDAPRHTANGSHYWMARTCLIDCASTLDGSAWKFTCERYSEVEPSFGLSAHSRTERMFLAVELLDWWVETMAYS